MSKIADISPHSLFEVFVCAGFFPWSDTSPRRQKMLKQRWVCWSSRWLSALLSFPFLFLALPFSINMALSGVHWFWKAWGKIGSCVTHGLHVNTMPQVVIMYYQDKNGLIVWIFCLYSAEKWKDIQTRQTRVLCVTSFFHKKGNFLFPCFVFFSASKQKTKDSVCLNVFCVKCIIKWLRSVSWHCSSCSVVYGSFSPCTVCGLWSLWWKWKRSILNSL